MTDQTPTATERAEKLQGLGSARKRVEDARFTQGKGNYVDDIKLPGMLFGDFVRSPYGHARITSIDKAAALALPGELAAPGPWTAATADHNERRRPLPERTPPA